MAKFQVQRKIIAWEEVVIEAETVDDAQDKAIWDTKPEEWTFLGDDMETTDDFWIMNLETEESRYM